MRDRLLDLPADLPVPMNDGQCDHLTGMLIPQVRLFSTDGEWVSTDEIFSGRSLLFIYPRAGSPLETNADPQLWDSIPGARGCTPQSCAFRDLHQEFRSRGVAVFGLSIQSPEVQKEFVERNHIPFPILSDNQYEFARALRLPTFPFDGSALIKRMALVIESRRIVKVFYPVFPPDKNAATVLEWLKSEEKC